MIIYRTPTKVGTKEVDETDIANDKILKYNAITGKVEYENDIGGLPYDAMLGSFLVDPATALLFYDDILGAFLAIG